VEDQATIGLSNGQRKNVQVHKYVCIGTLEEKIDELIESSANWPVRSSAPGKAG